MYNFYESRRNGNWNGTSCWKVLHRSRRCALASESPIASDWNKSEILEILSAVSDVQPLILTPDVDKPVQSVST